MCSIWPKSGHINAHYRNRRMLNSNSITTCLDCYYLFEVLWKSDMCNTCPECIISQVTPLVVSYTKILWRACCRQCGMCWQPLLGKHHVTYFLCGLTPACYTTMGRLCFLCGLFPGYITSELQGRGQLRQSVKWVMARDATRGGCRVGAEVFRGREETQLLWVVKCRHCKLSVTD
jgi:hypothetical protein